jgi:hypothetical protein
MRRTTVATVPAEPGETGGRLAARAASKLAVLVPPWLMLGLTAGAGGISHAVWGQPPHVTWVAIAATLATTGLTGLTWAITHARRMLGRVHATATTAAAAGWLTVVTVTGFGPDVVTGALWWGGGFLALSWNLRAVIRHIDPDQGGSGDALGALFDRAKEQAGLKGARARTKEIVPDRKVKGALALEPGKSTVDDVQRAIGKLESGMQVPPGTLAVAADPDRADLAEITVSDPRVLRKPIPWAGPSRPGASIAEPIRVGVWQDGDDSEFLLPGRHLQVMGMTGSGKSIGGCWNTLGEAMTRDDVAIFAIDTSKDDQTLGPLRPGLARLDTNKTDATRLLRAMHAKIPERTKWLAQHGHSKWEKGCGLLYWVLWIEEAAKFLNNLSSKDEERFEEIVKEIRSAGGSVVLSLQRSDYTQMPTLIRGQLAKMCFGLSSADDARWGLSTRQQKVDTVEPEAWEANYPGMYFLDAPGVTEKHAYMPGRSFDWGTSGRTAMAAHATTYAHVNRQSDQFTADLINLPTTTANGAATSHNTTQDDDVDDLDDGYGETDDLDEQIDDNDGGEDFGVADDVLTEAAAMDGELADPDPALTAAVGPDSPIQQPTTAENEALSSDNPSQKLSPTDARAALLTWLDQRAATGDLSFKASDDGLAALRHQIGMSRAWTYKVLRELVDNDRLTVDNGVYTITTHDPGHGHDGGQVAA